MDARAGKVQGLIELEAAVAAPNYAPLPVVLERGEGSWLWDADGRRYLDFMSAYSAVSHGHATLCATWKKAGAQPACRLCRSEFPALRLGLVCLRL